LIAAVMRARKQQEWLEALERQGIPCGPINALDHVFTDPQAIARGLRFDLPHALAGSVPQVTTPIRYSAAALAYDRPPPLLGEDTADVLAGRLGLDASEIDALAARGVIHVRR
jgi:crotonobetainyl-CoA:carnitine CoA-transferase CaiB-like acyl-CoA transferase